VILIEKIFIPKGFAISNISILFTLALYKMVQFYLEYNFSKHLYFSLSSYILQPFSTKINYKKNLTQNSTKNLTQGLTQILAKNMYEKIRFAK